MFIKVHVRRIRTWIPTNTNSSTGLVGIHTRELPTQAHHTHVHMYNTRGMQVTRGLRCKVPQTLVLVVCCTCMYMYMHIIYIYMYVYMYTFVHVHTSVHVIYI